MRTARDILATVTFLGTALVFYMVQTAPPAKASTSAKVASSSSEVVQCDLAGASEGAATGIVTKHLPSVEKVFSRGS